MASSTGLSSLPAELIQEIVSFVVSIQGFTSLTRPSDLRSLRLVCRLFKLAVDPLLFSVISFDFDLSLSILQHQISTLNDSTVSPSRYCRQLQIKRRSPNHDFAFSLIYHRRPILDLGDLKVDLTSAIKSLRNLRVFIWNITADELIKPVVDALTQLPQLEELHLDTLRKTSLKDSSIFSLQRLSHFRRISLKYAWSEHCIQPLTEIIGKSPLLTQLDINRSLPNDARPGKCMFHTLVQNVPKDAPLKLHHLGFICCHLKFDMSTFSHLKFLSSIHITSSGESRYDHLWSALGDATTWLKEITVDKISQNLLDYLTLYSGLVKFCLSGRFDTQRREDVDRLYNTSLSMHKHSLSTFGIEIDSPGVLCIIPNDMASILFLKGLRSLSLTLDLDPLGMDYSNDRISAAKQVIMAAFNLPLLREFIILSTTTLGQQGGIIINRYAKRAQNKMAKMILSADISHLDRSWKYFHLRVDERHFSITMSDNGCLRFADGRTVATRDV